MEKIFTIYCKNGTKDFVKGVSIKEALFNAGYDRYSKRTIDFYEIGDIKDLDWNAENKTWELCKNL